MRKISTLNKLVEITKKAEPDRTFRIKKEGVKYQIIKKQLYVLNEGQKQKVIDSKKGIQLAAIDEIEKWKGKIHYD